MKPKWTNVATLFTHFFTSYLARGKLGNHMTY